MVVELEVSKILDAYLPADLTNPEREKQRIGLHRSICVLVWNARQELLSGIEKEQEPIVYRDIVE